jgi:Protein of unknown function (DUF3515)
VPGPSLRRVLAAGGLLALAAGCGTDAVEVPAPRPVPAAAPLCDALRARSPHRLHGLAPRATTPKSPYVMAWGSPAIVLRCGVPRPAGLRPTSELAVINGISWLGLPTGRPITFTAVGRLAYVEVTVPAKYAPSGDVLIDLSGPIKAAVPPTPDGSL